MACIYGYELYNKRIIWVKPLFSATMDPIIGIIPYKSDKYLLIRSTMSGKLSYSEFKGYSTNPKNNAKRTDVISVKRLKITEPALSKIIAKKNVDKKIQQLLVLMMKVLETESTDDDFLVLDEADRLRSLIINEYAKALGIEYRNSALKKIDYIVKMFNSKRVYSKEEIIEKTGKSR